MTLHINITQTPEQLNPNSVINVCVDLDCPELHWQQINHVLAVLRTHLKHHKPVKIDAVATVDDKAEADTTNDPLPPWPVEGEDFEQVWSAWGKGQTGR